MKIVLLIVLLLMPLTVESGLLGTFYSGDTFDILPDGSQLVYQGITADNTILIVRKLGGNIQDFIPIGIPATTKPVTFARTLFGNRYAFQVLSDKGLVITKME